MLEGQAAAALARLAESEWELRIFRQGAGLRVLTEDARVQAEALATAAVAALALSATKETREIR